MAWSGSALAREKSQINEVKNRRDEGSGCLSVDPDPPGVKAQHELWIQGGKKVPAPRDFCTWYFLGRMPFANTEFAACDNKR
jgi:hypothetical protein